MKRFLITAILAVAILISLVPVEKVQAERGVPGSAEFGYGAWIHPQGSQLDSALKAVQDLQLDWVAMDVDWAALMPASTSMPDLSNLDRSISFCSQTGTAVMLSLDNPPTWAMGQDGPDAGLTAQFVQNLANRYGNTVQAIELFAGANTRSGWGTAPNPIAYANLFQTVQTGLTQIGSDVLLVAGGLVTGSADPNDNTWEDVDFLRVLYAAGAKNWMEVLSLQFTNTSGSPVNTPAEGGASSLRHYEALRQVMLENGHEKGLIWITLINPPDGTINSQDQAYLDSQKQAEWLQQALVQTRSQLYMGAAFIDNINSPANATGRFSHQALLQADQSLHPFYTVLKAIIQQTNPETGSTPPGRPKTGTLLKCQKKT